MRHADRMKMAEGADLEAAGLQSGDQEIKGGVSSEVAFREQVRQKRLAIDEQMEAIIARAGAASADPFSVAHPVYIHMEFDGVLGVAEAHVRAVCGQLEVDRRLPPEFREVADAAVKSVAMKCLNELLYKFGYMAEISAKYFKPTILVYRESLDLLRVLKRHIGGHGK